MRRGGVWQRQEDTGSSAKARTGYGWHQWRLARRIMKDSPQAEAAGSHLSRPPQWRAKN